MTTGMLRTMAADAAAAAAASGAAAAAVSGAAAAAAAVSRAAAAASGPAPTPTTAPAPAPAITPCSSPIRASTETSAPTLISHIPSTIESSMTTSTAIHVTMTIIWASIIPTPTYKIGRAHV